ncbi:NAD-dependent epimerase/dehydratase family protein [Mycobacterium sp. NPDC050041]|uniref:NAD-dependent epimerase/dehydratase family protein n=1 Tax=Mycobacterium sp. NPDC050041 TaxID=3364293 RepID=UPI003C30E715
MRVVVTGASGNVGAGVLRALHERLPDAQVVGVCRRPPTTGEKYERVRWHAVDLASPTAATDLEPAMRDADVVIHLALAIQPLRDTDYLYRANVIGTQSLLSAMTAAGVRQLVYASSLGIYAPGRGEPVSEDWPDTGQPASTYSRHKVMVERILDRFVEEHPDTVVARFRPTVVVQREAAWLIRSLYLGPLVPRAALELLRRGAIRVLPLPRGIALQFVHADDVGDAVIRMMQQRAHGSYNIAANVLDSTALAAVVGARAVGVNPKLMRIVVSALSVSRVVALTPGWYDVATNSPVMDTSKARRELGWAPTRTSAESAIELLDGMADGAAGTSAAMGWNTEEKRMSSRTIQYVHDASLLTWSGLALARALGVGRAGAPDAAVVALNLASGTPMALDRVLARRRDPAALLAPLAVVTAVATSLRGGWAPVAATTVLSLLAASERRRAKRSGQR